MMRNRKILDSAFLGCRELDGRVDRTLMRCLTEDDHQRSTRGHDQRTKKIFLLAEDQSSYRDDAGRTVLHWAASMKNGWESLQRVREVLAKHPNPKALLKERDYESGWTAMHRAVYAGNIRVLVELLQLDKDTLHARDWESLSPLDLYYETFVANLRPEDQAEILESRGRGVCVWGANYDFQLGLVNPSQSTSPSGGKFRTLRIFAQTSRDSGGLGNAQVAVVQVATAPQHSLFLSETGHVYVSGFGASGRLGLPDRVPCDSNDSRHGIAWPTPSFCLQPTLLTGIDYSVDRVRFVHAGGNRSAALTEKGVLLVWGGEIWTPRVVQSLLKETIEMVSVGTAHTLALSKNGRIFSASSAAPDCFRELVTGVLGEYRFHAIAAGDDLLSAAIARCGNYDQAFVWHHDFSAVQKVVFGERHESADTGLRSKMSKNRFDARKNGRPARFTRVNAGHELVALLSSHGDLFLVETGRVSFPGESTVLPPLPMNVKAVAAYTGWRKKYPFVDVACGGRVCYALDRSGCVWFWDQTAQDHRSPYGKRIKGLRGVQSLSTCESHSAAIFLERKPFQVTVCFSDPQEKLEAEPKRVENCLNMNDGQKITQMHEIPPKLSVLCEQKLKAIVSFDTAMDFLQHWGILDAPDLFEKCLSFVHLNLDTIMTITYDGALRLDTYDAALTRLENELKQVVQARNKRLAVMNSTEHLLERSLGTSWDSWCQYSTVSASDAFIVSRQTPASQHGSQHSSRRARNEKGEASIDSGGTCLSNRPHSALAPGGVHQKGISTGKHQVGHASSALHSQSAPNPSIPATLMPSLQRDPAEKTSLIDIMRAEEATCLQQMREHSKRLATPDDRLRDRCSWAESSRSLDTASILSRLGLPFRVQSSSRAIPVRSHHVIQAAASPTQSKLSESTSPGSFREILNQELNLCTPRSHYAQVSSSSSFSPPIWDQRQLNNGLASSIHDIENEERRKNQEHDEAVWLARQIQLIEEMETQSGQTRSASRASHNRNRIHNHSVRSAHSSPSSSKASTGH